MFVQQYIKFGKKYGPLMKDLWNSPQEKDAIVERYRPQFQTIKEGLSDDNTISIDDAGLQAAATLGSGLMILYVVLGVIYLGIFIWNIVALVHFWKRLDTIWKVLGLVFLLLGMSPISLILIYVGKSLSHKKRHHHDDDDDDDDNDDDDDDDDDSNNDRRRQKPRKSQQKDSGNMDSELDRGQ